MADSGAEPSSAAPAVDALPLDAASDDSRDEHTDAPVAGAAGAPQGMSKSAMKRQAKREKFAEQRREQRAAKKARKREKIEHFRHEEAAGTITAQSAAEAAAEQGVWLAFSFSAV